MAVPQPEPPRAAAQAKHNILCVHTGGTILRGSELALLDLLSGMMKRGRNILLLCDQPAMQRRAEELGIPTDMIPCGEFMIDPPEYKLNLLGLLRANAKALSVIRSFHADVLYCNSGRALQMSLLAAKLAHRPTSVHLHAPHNKRYLIGYGATVADLTIHCSDTIRQQHEAKTHFKRSVALRNALNLDRFTGLDALRRPAPDAVPVIGFVGSLVRRKGVDILIDGVYQLLKAGLPCKLKIAGREENDGYRQQVAALGIGEHVNFVGEIAQASIPDFFADVHIHALPSRSDALPLSIIEAAFCGVPTLAHDVGGIAEALMDGRFGIAYQTNTPEVFAQTLRTMLEDPQWMSTERSLEIARASRAEFNLDKNVDELCRLLDSLQ